MNKPREWWIRPWTDAQPDGFLSGKIIETTSYDVETEAVPDAIPVVERAAYDKAVKALKFYATKRVYPAPSYELEQDGGDLARHTLEELGEI